MPKRITNLLLLISLIIVGFSRSYLFYNIHFAKYYVVGKYPRSRTDSWLQWMDQMNINQLDNLKWIGTSIFLVLFFVITFFLIKFNFKKTKGVILLYISLIIFAFLAYILSILGVSYTFQISRRTLHFLQSPLPAAVLFLFYKFILPLQKSSIE